MLSLALMKDVGAQINGTARSISVGGRIKDFHEMEKSAANRVISKRQRVEQFFDKENEEEERREAEELYKKVNPMHASAKVKPIDEKHDVVMPPVNYSGKVTSQSPGYTARGNQERGLNPSDAQIAAGPNHVVVLANDDAKIIDKQTGTVITNVTLAAFFSWSGFVFDPRIMYDPYANRWVALALQNAGCNSDSKFRVLISNTSDPTQGWYWYDFDVDGANVGWMDFAKLGFNKDWICVAGNVRCANVPGLYVLSRNAAYAGGSANYFYWNSIELASPAFTYDMAIDKLYLVRPGNSNNAGTGYVDSWYINSVPQLFNGSSFGSSPWQAFSTDASGCPKQLGGPNFTAVNTFGHAITSNAVYRNGSLWFTHPIFLPATGTTNRVSTQWWQVDPSSGAVQQVGRIDDGSGATSEYYMSIGVNKLSDVVVTYSIFNASYYQSGAYNYRNSSDAPGTLPNGVFYVSGQSPDNDGRGGDYSQTAVDPLDDQSFWVVNQIPNGSWETWFALIPAYFGCYTDATFGNTVWTGYTKNEASGTITSAEMIQSPSMVEYDAGSRITLSPGFRANAGARFRAYIDGCNNFRTPPARPGATVIAPDITAEKTKSNDLFSIYPNPSNQFFKLNYDLKNDENVMISVYSYDMKPVKQLMSARKSAGLHQETIDVKSLPAGVYFVQFLAGEKRRTEKIVVVH